METNTEGQLIKVPAAKVGLSTSSVYPETTSSAFELARRLGVPVHVYPLGDERLRGGDLPFTRYGQFRRGLARLDAFVYRLIAERQAQPGRQQPGEQNDDDQDAERGR